MPKASGIGGMKAPTKRTLAGPGAMSPHRAAAVSPPLDEDPMPTTPAPQPRVGLGRGGLAGRSLAKPSAMAAAQPVAPPSPTPMSGLMAVERAELEELRLSNDRLLRNSDDARQERSRFLSEIQELKNQNAGLIEDHTRDVLSIKAKETQLVRARSDAEAAEQTNERLRRELDRLKRALSKAEAALVNGSGMPASGMASPGFASPTHDDAGIYRDGAYPTSASRNRMSYTSTMSEEKENGETAAYPRSKLSPDMRYGGGGGSSGRGSPARGFRRDLASGTEDMPVGAGTGVGGAGGGGHYVGTSSSSNGGAGSPAAGVTGQESWKRAAEVTNQLKARIEQMKVSFP